MKYFITFILFILITPVYAMNISTEIQKKKVEHYYTCLKKSNFKCAYSIYPISLIGSSDNKQAYELFLKLQNKLGSYINHKYLGEEIKLMLIDGKTVYLLYETKYANGTAKDLFIFKGNDAKDLHDYRILNGREILN